MKNEEKQARYKKQAEKEKKIFEKFREASECPELNPYDKLECPTEERKDPPDIIVTKNNKRIGIEITDWYLKDGNEEKSEQKQADRRRRLIKILEEKWNAKKREGNFILNFGDVFINFKEIEKLTNNIEEILFDIYNKKEEIKKHDHRNNDNCICISKDRIHKLCEELEIPTKEIEFLESICILKNCSKKFQETGWSIPSEDIEQITGDIERLNSLIKKKRRKNIKNKTVQFL